MTLTPAISPRLRQLVGLSLRKLADLTSISKSTLHLWEHGKDDVLHSSEIRAIRNVILEFSGANHKEVVRLLKGRTPTGRDGLRPRQVEVASRDRRSELVPQGAK